VTVGAGCRCSFQSVYADDFVVLGSGSREQAEQEKAALAAYLRQSTGLELSEQKTRISDLTEGVGFLGHRVRLKWHRRFGLMPGSKSQS
jgi:RNA-directed DNA polymerase